MTAGVSDGELATGEAFTRLRRLLRVLGANQPAVILEGGSISAAHLDYARRQLKSLSELGFTDELSTAW